MKERKLTVNLTWANVFSLLVLVVVLVPTSILWNFLWGVSFDLFASGTGVLFFLVLFLSGIVVHELIHGLTWAYFAKSGWESISFGVLWKMLTPYCHCSEPLQVKPYIIGALMPLFVLGIVPWVIGLAIGSFLTTLFGAFYIMAASGDILVAWKLRHEDAKCTVLDHPTEPGCIIYEEETV